MRDTTEYIDELCRDNYGHTNWAFADSLTEEELNDPNIAENDGMIVFYQSDIDEYIDEDIEE
jgi:hypothetical protein